MNSNNVQYTFVPIKIETVSNVVDVIPTIEYAVVPNKVPKAEPRIIDDEIVPEQFIPTSSLYLEDYIRPQELLVCRACLLSDCRLYSMRGHNLEEIYKCLTNTRPLHNDNIPLLLCAKCACFLDKCQQFSQKTNIAQDTLNSLAFPVTYKQIKKTYEKVNIKFSSLTVKHMPPDHYDYFVTKGFPDAKTLNIKPEPKSDDDERNDKKPPVEDDDETDYDEPLSNVSKFLKIEIEKEVVPKKHDPTNKSNVSKNKKKRKHEGTSHYKRHEVKNVFKKQKYTLEQQLAELQKRKECVEYKFYKYKCDICFMSYNQEDRYKEHMSRHVEVFGNFVCEVCTLRFKTRSALLHHNRSHRWHYSCMHCPFETNARKAVIRHVYKHKDKLSQCERSGDVPSKSEEGCSNNTAPRKRKQANVYVICEICGKSLQLGVLKAHMEEHDGKTFKCEACNRVFSNSLKYQKHIKCFHSGGNHDCPHCGKQYNAERSKLRHINLAHKPGTFECKLCSKVFKSCDYLKRHEEYVHYKTKTYKYRYDPAKRKKKAMLREKPEPDPLKPFVCEHCYKGFKNKAYLQQHLNFVHYKKPRSKYWRTKAEKTTSNDTDVQ